MINPKGITIRQSHTSVKETIDSLQFYLQQQGIKVYTRINQQAEANNNGHHLLPLEFILFGNPKAGGAIMEQNPLSALDLPLKIIAWEDVEKKIWIAYNDADYIEERYALPHNPASPVSIDHIVNDALKL